MKLNLARGNWSKILVVLAVLGVVAFEIFVVFFDRRGEFAIQGVDAYDIDEFGSGAAVSQAFLMRGDGLNAVRLRFASEGRTTVSVHWTLWRGFADEPEQMTRAFEGEDIIELRPGRQWIPLNFIRDGSSRDRWYTIEARLNVPGDADSAQRPNVALVATRDNPERGGILWVDGVRQPGSLTIRAEREGRTLHRRLDAEVEPNLPPLLRSGTVQWVIVVIVHLAFAAFAKAILRESKRGDGSRA